MSIPDWNFAGVIPPIRPGKSGVDPDRAPYKTSVVELIERFGTTQDRLDILFGLIKYRSELARIGLDEGFQWLDGSFSEDVEANESRSPGDIDVVTFALPPNGRGLHNFLGNEPELVEKGQAKRKYRVDPYFVQLGQPIAEWNTKLISYWYSVWSHRRNGVWKGFVQVDLNTMGDAEAMSVLQTMKEKIG